MVTEVCRYSERLVSLRMRAADERPLPSYVPGSHLAVACGDGINAYSLTGSGLYPERYAVSVRLDAAGAGGSVAMHRLRPGDVLRSSRPRSQFAPVAQARRHLLLAGGIGVTPILSHARAAHEWGTSADVLYVHRPGEGIHAAELRELAGPQLSVACLTSREAFGRALRGRLAGSPLGTHLYACGPEPFMEAVLRAAREHGWPEGRLHAESFGAASLDPGEPFGVKLPDGTRIPVPAGVSLLEALESAGRAVPNMCRQGVCGQCALTVTAGRPLHRDHYLTEAEKEENRLIMSCVSRSLDRELEVRP
nr:PDR/VanB family oxidoreductase [Sediminivirga luteola]